MKPAIILLTCPNEKEADTIVVALLKKRLIACAKKIYIKSRYRWHGKIERDSEVLLLLEGEESMFKDIEAAVRKLHSHKTFVLMSFPASRVAKGVAEWIEESVHK